MPDSATFPRFATIPHPRAVGSWGESLEEFIAAERATVTGERIELRWWQRFFWRRALEYFVDEDGAERPCWTQVLSTTSRQSGKSVKFREGITWRLTRHDLFGPEETAVLTSRDIPVANEIQRPVRLWAKTAEGWWSTASNGKEQVECTSNANRWVLRAETGIYGASAKIGMFVDECWDVDVATIEEGVEPTLAEAPAGQLFLTSTAHRRATPLFPGRRRQAIEDLETVNENTLLLEWSAHVTNPDDLELDDLDDVEIWRQASPHWSDSREDLIRRRFVAIRSGEAEDASNDVDPEVALRTQWLNLWSAHQGRRKQKGEPLVEDLTHWLSIERVCGPADDAVLSVEDYGGLGCAVAWCGATDDGKPVIGARTFEHRSEAYDLLAAYADHAIKIVAGATLSSDPDLRTLSVAIEFAGWTETRVGLAKLREAIGTGRIWQDGSPALATQLGEARVRQADSGLSLTGERRSDALRCAVWALQAWDDLQTSTGAVH
jgi:hypothetical protein